MRRFLPFTMLLALASAPAHAADDSVKFPAYHRTVLPNGVTLMVMEKHSAPLVSFVVTLKTGSLADPPGKEGLADTTNDLLRKGAGQRNATQISEDFDFVGATLGTAATYEALRVSAEFMKKDVNSGLDLLSDILLHPTFPQEEVDKLIKQRVDALKARKDQPLAVINAYYEEFLFGSHPYGRPPNGDERSMGALRREDIVHFHEQNYVAGNLIVAVCGDFQTAEMERLLTARFGALPKKAATGVSAPKPEASTGRLLFVDKPDATQTFFQFGNVGIARNDPDRAAVDVVNTLFGGRFTSWINTALRIDSGLTYGASSVFSRRRQPGSFYINSYTRNEKTAEAMDMAVKVLKDLHEKGFTDEQLKSAKEYIKGQFGPRVETSDQLANWMTEFEIYGLDAKEVDEYAARVDTVTVADAKRVIEKHYPLNNLVFAVIGKGSEVEPLMKKYATQIEKVSISDPGYGRK
jgi:zinc protease